jgi:hypothetical protein
VKCTACAPTEWQEQGSYKGPAELHYDEEENICIQITRTVTCDMSGINPGNNQLQQCETNHFAFLNKEMTV